MGRKKNLVVFDELHKMKGWKSWLKDIYDVEGNHPAFLVTGSARLDTARKAGDSLDVKEAKTEVEPKAAVDRILSLGGFPEPFLANDGEFARRWRRTHVDTILRQDLVDTESVRDIAALETLIELLRRRVGSPVSGSSLARDLERDPNTVKRWLAVLESMYVVFRVAPYHRNVARSLLKEPKFYFYDTGLVAEDPGALWKECHRVTDCEGRGTELRYLRTKDGREMDFAVFVEGKAPLLMEAKHGDDAPSRAFSHFAPFFPEAVKVQLVRGLDRDRTYPDGLEVRDAAAWLSGFAL